MKIVGVETYRVDVPVAPIEWRAGLPRMPAVSEDVWIRVLTDEGVDGWSPMEYWGPVTEHLVDRWLRDLAIGSDPLLKEDLFHRVWELDRLEALPKYVIGVLDVACWDITAKVAGLPLYLLLGGARERIAAYASTVTFPTIEEYLDVADQCLALGFRAIKLHAWGDARRDAELCQRLRDHVGPEIALMYDGSAAFNAADALYVGRACEAADYLWFEEPMREVLIGSYRRLCDQLDIAVLAPENLEGAHYAVAEFLASGATDLARTGTETQGGVTGALRIAHVADAFGTTAEVHGMGLPNLHLCCGVRNTTYYESIVANPVVREAGIDAEGFIAAPTQPGIGFDAAIQGLVAQP